MSIPLSSRCNYPPNLPVSLRAGEIISAIKANQVLIVAGHTGSGKTTQLPKMCVQAGFGEHHQIAHTQPRRLAAITVAERLAEELQSPLGVDVGYQIRFDKRYAENCRIKLQTDGVLLNEIQHDPLLRAYDCIIIDEAHERSMNIDFLLGYLKRLLRTRPELHLVITSATIDTQRFSEFFFDAPVIEVSGQTFPVDFRYRPMNESIADLNHAIALAVQEIETLDVHTAEQDQISDILCFLSTEQEIVEAGRFLRGKLKDRFDVLSLYARLPAKAQKQVFERKPSSRRRLILATNIAETSVTVPAIGFVIDAGFSRISRYSYHSKIQQLPIEEISQASANQRAGRCGRLAPGTCIRLYSQQNFDERGKYSEPEILRTNLAAVILKLYSIGVRELEDFEFVDSPDPKLLRDGERLLEELQAINRSDDKPVTLSKYGLSLARLPLEPRLGRVLLAGHEGACLRECLILCAALSTIDPRERPAGKQAQADDFHKRFSDPRSDFISLIKLWRYLQEKKKALSPSSFRNQLRKEFLSWQRCNDWFDVEQQLSTFARDSDLRMNKKPASFEAIHRALLSGFPTQVGLLGEKREFLGTRQRRFRIFPGSGLAASPPACVVAAEIVETSAVYGRTVARVKPQWVMAAAKHLLKESFEDPFYDSATGTVKAYQSASLQGLKLSDRKPAKFPCHGNSQALYQARQLFIQQALIEGQLHCEQAFAVHNRKVIEQAQTVAWKLRRPELLCVDEALTSLFEQHLPAHVCSARQFEKWLTSLGTDGAGQLELEAGSLLLEPVGDEQLALFPDVISVAGNQFAVRYSFMPGEPKDGLEILVPQAMAALLSDHSFDDLVPGMLADKCTALFKSLPKSLRRPLVPVADSVALMFADIQSASGPLLHRLQAIAKQRYQVTIEEGDWDMSRLSEYQFPIISVLDQGEQIISSYRAGQKLSQNQPASATPSAAKAVSPAAIGETSVDYFMHGEFDGRVLGPGDYPDLPSQFDYTVMGLSYLAYPGLLFSNDEVRVCLYHKLNVARLSSAWALSLLCQRSMAPSARSFRGRLFSGNADVLALSVFPDREQFQRDCLQRLFYEGFICADSLPENQAAFQRLLKSRRAQLEPVFTDWSAVFADIISAHYDLVQSLESVTSSHFQDAVRDVMEQVKGLLCNGFLRSVPTESLRQYPRYLAAATQRIKRLREQQGRDVERQTKLLLWEQQLRADVKQPNGPLMLFQQPFYWLLQEYRVSLFAQGLGTAVPVSETRLKAAWDLRFEADS